MQSITYGRTAFTILTLTITHMSLYTQPHSIVHTDHTSMSFS